MISRTCCVGTALSANSLIEAAIIIHTSTLIPILISTATKTLIPNLIGLIKDWNV